MGNVQLGIEKMKEEMEKVQGGVGAVRDVDSGGFVQKDLVKIANWEAGILEKGRKAAMQE